MARSRAVPASARLATGRPGVASPPRRASRAASEVRPRLYAVTALILALALVISARLVVIQVLQHGHFRTLATEEHWRQTSLPARRGDILDVDGNPLATTVAFQSLYASTNEIRRPEQVAARLAPILGTPEKTLRAELSRRQTAPVLLARGLGDPVAERIRAQDLPGLFFQIEPRRVYPQGNLAAQLLGVVGVDGNGLSGLELRLDRALAGRPGEMVAERDTAGDAIPFGPHQISPPVNGATVILTVDRYVQWVAERELSAAVRAEGLRGGSIVVMDPRSGAVFAVAGRPTFDHSAADLYSSQAIAHYGIPAITDALEPGTVFKPFALAAAIDSRAVTAETVFANTGSFPYAGTVYSDPAHEPVGREALSQALQRPGTFALAWAATRAGAPAFYAVLARFGFGRSTGIDLPGESSGALRPPTAPDWFATDLPTNAAGRGFQATTVQLAVATAALANHGVPFRPYVVQRVGTEAGAQQFKPTAEGPAIRPETAVVVTRLLVASVDDPEGAAHAAAVPGYQVAGAAGTVEAPVPGGYNQTQDVATFVGYAPADRPRFVVVVRLDGVKGNSAAPAAAAGGAIVRELLSYYQIPPGQPGR